LDKQKKPMAERQNFTDEKAKASGRIVETVSNNAVPLESQSLFGT